VSQNSRVEIKEKGAKGDGVSNDWLIIQKTIDDLIKSGGGTIHFPKGNYAIYDKSIVIWGDNITLEGDGPSLTRIVKMGGEGYFGDCIDISGKIRGFQYFGQFGTDIYARRTPYSGATIRSNNIGIKNLTISTKFSENSHQNSANNLGIINSSNVNIVNCIIENAPQTNVAIVNDTKQTGNNGIYFSNCIFQNSGQHNVRVVSYNQGNFIDNNVVFDSCKFLNVIGFSSNDKEISDKKVLLWYRGGMVSGKTSVSLNNCYFDSTGMIYGSVNVNGLSITGSKVDGPINIQQVPRLDANPRIVIENNTFRKNVGNSIKAMSTVNKVISGPLSTNFGSVYPNSLMNGSRIRIKNNISN